MSVRERRRTAQTLGYCMNCLARSHRSYDCHSEVACLECGGEHHTLLHTPTREGSTSYDEVQIMQREDNIRRLEEAPRRRPQRRERANQIRPNSAPPPSSVRARRILQMALRTLRMLYNELNQKRN